MTTKSVSISEFHSTLAFDDSARRREAGVEDLLRGHFARLQPVLDLRQQLPPDFPHALHWGRGLLFDTPPASAHLLDDCLGRCDQLFALLDELLENLLLFRFRFGEQLMVLAAVINLLRFLDSRWRRLSAAPSELLQGPRDPLGPAFTIPGSCGYPSAGSCPVVSEESILRSVKPTAVAVRMSSALIAALPAPANAASARALCECRVRAASAGGVNPESAAPQRSR